MPAAGFHLQISAVPFEGRAAAHYCGVGRISGAPNVACPNCSKRMFPALNLWFGSPDLAGLSLWPTELAHVLVCPSCAHYMEPYVIRHRPSLRVEGGEIDGGDILNHIDHPYAARLIVAVPFDQRDETAPQHFVGGEIPAGAPKPGRCPDCRSPMKFFGKLDTDGHNVPLTEDGGRPVALIIGDGDSLSLSSCASCAILRAEWTR